MTADIETLMVAEGGVMSTLAEKQVEVFEWAESKGWNDPGPTFGEAIALLHSECSEALEEYRVHGVEPYYMALTSLRGATAKFVAKDHDYQGEKPLGVPSEFADVLIRLLHYAQVFGVDLEAEYAAKMQYNHTRAYRHGGRSL
jgi:NTP pyrophosphatase (non-canonical NTP hydrolase)